MLAAGRLSTVVSWPTDMQINRCSTHVRDGETRGGKKVKGINGGLIDDLIGQMVPSSQDYCSCRLGADRCISIVVGGVVSDEHFQQGPLVRQDIIR